MEEEQGNYFPLILKDEKLTPETLKGELKKKLKLLTNIDMETHYPKIYECILKVIWFLRSFLYYVENYAYKFDVRSTFL